MWDAMQFMGPALLNATVERLADIMRPKSYLLAFFTVNDKVQEVSSYSFRAFRTRRRSWSPTAACAPPGHGSSTTARSKKLLRQIRKREIFS